MPFEKGHAKVGGRKPGSLNKTTSIKEALADFKWGKEFVENYAELKPYEKVQVLRWVAEYLFPKARANEAVTDDLEEALNDVRVLFGHKKERDGV